MDLQLTGKRALVTGSNSGMGVAVATRLAEEGARVIVHGRNRERAEAVAQAIRDAGNDAIAITGDLSTQEGCNALWQAVEDAFGGLDILINNAGGSDDATRTWETSHWPDWIEEFEMNAGSAMRMTELALPHMIAQKWGRIINVSSAQATMPFPHSSPGYNAVKAGIINTTTSLAKTYGKHGITVNCISPGPVDSAVFREFALELPPIKGKTFEEAEPFLADKWGVSVGRLGRPDDMAGAYVFLSSPLARFINGVTLRVDGGMCGFINV
jgi:NAD(P)-dependent dehydrogenase (short-subunit alcohol dehydrogenase family)